VNSAPRHGRFLQEALRSQTLTNKLAVYRWQEFMAGRTIMFYRQSITP
jgi:hypothetical protein